MQRSTLGTLADKGATESLSEFYKMRSKYSDYWQIPSSAWYEMYHLCEVAYTENRHPMAAFEMGLVTLNGEPQGKQAGVILGTYWSKYACEEEQAILKKYWSHALLLCHDNLYYGDGHLLPEIKAKLLDCAQEYLNHFLVAQHRIPRRMIYAALIIYELLLDENLCPQKLSTTTSVQQQLETIREHARKHEYRYCCRFWRNGE